MTIPESQPADLDSPGDAHSAHQERRRRPEPKRTGPIRAATGYFRDSHSWGEEAHPAWREPVDVIDDAVTHGVHLGYRVIDEHLRKGREAAAKLRTDETSADSADLRRLLDRVQCLSKDFGSVCFEALDLLAQSPALLRWLSRSEADSAHSASAGTDPSARVPTPPAFAIEIASRRRILVSMHVPGDAATFDPGIHALHSGEPGVPAMTSARFHNEPPSGAPVLAIDVPDQQPPGLYSGVIVDRASNEPKGTLSVRIFP